MRAVVQGAAVTLDIPGRENEGELTMYEKKRGAPVFL
jgi:hypothetical protein